jgi:hypothetical protein
MVLTWPPMLQPGAGADPEHHQGGGLRHAAADDAQPAERPGQQDWASRSPLTKPSMVPSLAKISKRSAEVTPPSIRKIKVFIRTGRR